MIVAIFRIAAAGKPLRHDFADKAAAVDGEMMDVIGNLSMAEEGIRDALSRLMQGRAVIAVAHRLSTLRNVDRIVALQNGNIVPDGEPERLLRADGPYRTLVTKELNRLSRRAA